jgi:hypothetical protein
MILNLKLSVEKGSNLEFLQNLKEVPEAIDLIYKTNKGSKATRGKSSSSRAYMVKEEHCQTTLV